MSIISLMFKQFRKEIKEGIPHRMYYDYGYETRREFYLLALIEYTKNDEEIWERLIEYNKYDVSSHGRLRDTCSNEILNQVDGELNFNVNVINNYGRKKEVKMSILVQYAFFDGASPELRLKRAKNDEADDISEETISLHVKSGGDHREFYYTDEFDHLHTDTEEERGSDY